MYSTTTLSKQTYIYIYIYIYTHIQSVQGLMIVTLGNKLGKPGSNQGYTLHECF